MKSFVIAIVLLLAVSTIAEEGEAVLDLTSENFDQVIKDNELILVEFYAPWCGHCKRLAPEYEKAAQELKGSIPLAKVNADEENNRPLASRFGIRGFPTLKLFRNGNPTDYEGERSSKAIVSFLKKQARPAITAVANAEEAKKLIGEDKVVVIGFFANREGKEYEAFKSVSESLRNKFVFGEIVGNTELNTEYGVETPNVVLFKQFDEGKNILGADFENLNTFINSNSVPLIDEIGPENYRNYAEAGIPLAYVFVNLNTDGEKDTYVDRVKELAQSSKGKLNWVYIDSAKYARHGEKLGLSGTKSPALAIEDMQTGKHWAFSEEKELTAEAIKEWIGQFLAGTLEATVKSEPIPEDNSAPVKTVVAKNFEELVYDENKDVFVEFYAPWCGHCKKLAPTYDELGKAFENTPTVTIAKIDATANDVDPSLGIRGFPTIKLFTAKDKKNPIDYNGDRTLADMINFIKQHASTPVQVEAAAAGNADAGHDEL